MERSLALLLHYADKLFKNDINVELAKLKLNSADLAVIMDLYLLKKIGSEESRTETIMADRLLIDRKRFKDIISDLMERDWVVKIPSQIDRRSEELFLSSKAESLAEYLTQTYTYSEDRAFKNFNADEKKEFINYLVRVVKNLKRD
jgi:DNA-binding MarR family transcriptional regulator